MVESRRRLPRLVAWGAPALVLAAQLVPVERSNPPVTADLGAPEPVRELLVRACYDCHSHETSWPWYAGVAPVSWLVAHDVREGRAELNFSRWEAGSGRSARRLRRCAEELAEGEMPPWPYLAMHPEARLLPGERDELAAWLRGAGAPPSRGGGDDDLR